MGASHPQKMPIQGERSRKEHAITTNYRHWLPLDSPANNVQRTLPTSRDRARAIIMIRHGNGRFRPPGGPDDSLDPNDFFPAREDFIDCCGVQRWFIISMDAVELGYAISAAEDETEGRDGYYFREFDPNSPFLALGRLRGRIRRALATHHLEERSPGTLLPLHDTLRGRIAYSSEEDEVAFVIDGKFIALSQFAKMVEMYEGWQFRMDFIEEGEEVR